VNRTQAVGGASRWLVHASALGVLLLAIVLVGVGPSSQAEANLNVPSLSARALSVPGLAASAPTASANSIGAAPLPLTVVSPVVEQQALLAASDSTNATLSQLEGAAQAASQPDGGTVSAREQEQIPLFNRYEVQEGDSVSSIAEKFGVAREYILWNNIEVIDDANLLQPGMLLQIPAVEGIIHAVRLDETLTQIAAQYDADVQDIIDFPANNLSDPNQLQEGSMILVPGGRIVPPPAETIRPQEPAPEVVTRDASATGFIWPVIGPITSQFGPSHPLGIDIGAPYVPIAAAAAGQVVFVGGDPCCSYGNYIEIDHGDGYSTRYAHLSEFKVSLGDHVEQGQIIGISGTTGHSTGPHLHFELRRNGEVVNPMLFLP
jgi:murein DD-endopeptidase MepM/ murein hydrolase activator NlpD